MLGFDRQRGHAWFLSLCLLSLRHADLSSFIVGDREVREVKELSMQVRGEEPWTSPACALALELLLP